MKKTWILLAFTCLLSIPGTYAQQKQEKIGISLSGYVKNDFFYDSRQTVNAREGHFLLWPAPLMPDANGIDLNDQPTLTMLAIQTRLTTKIKGPDAFGAKTSGLIEGDFFGQANANINLFRLRHAMVKFKWENTELITGQYWNPLFVAGCFPATIAFNTGVPIASFSRDPQIRLTHTVGKVSFLIAALSQRDYPSRGPDPSDNALTLVSSEFLRNSTVPDMHLRISYNSGNENNGANILAGAGVEWKKIVPRLYTVIGDKKYRVNESLSSYTVIVYSKITLPAITIKLQGRYGENIADVLSVSGFAVRTPA
ncbi:MAG TPA: hypothetical protein VE870_07690, partial [Bacteroidales bacterium]|nr:hypothetical protein [Bacteroidales bacterium]